MEQSSGAVTSPDPELLEIDHRARPLIHQLGLTVGCGQVWQVLVAAHGDGPGDVSRPIAVTASL